MSTTSNTQEQTANTSPSKMERASKAKEKAKGLRAAAGQQRDSVQTKVVQAKNKKGKTTRKRRRPPIDPVVENSILSFKLKELVEYRKKEEEKNTKSFYKNIILLNTDEPGILQNNMNSFDPETVAPLLESTSIQLSNFVPTIEVFKVFKNQSTGKEVELVVPFPESSVKDDFTQILNQRVGRGGGIGIEYIEWNSMAKNDANLAQWQGKMAIYMQDPGELTKIRNTEVINKEAYSVSLLDFLYPGGGTNIQGSKEDVINKNRYYDPQEMTLKIKVGWQVNKQKIGDEKVTFDTKSSDMFLDALTTTYNITPSKHELNFEKDGSLKLEISFIATAIALLDDTRKSDIFYKEEYIKNLHSKFDSNIDRYEQQLAKKRKELRNTPRKNKDKRKEKIGEIKTLRKKIQNERQNIVNAEKKEKMRLFHSFLEFLNTNNLMYYYVVTKQEKERLKKLTEIKGEELNITTKKGKDNLELLIKSTTKTKESATEQPNLSSLTDIKTVKTPFSFLANSKNIKSSLDSKKIEQLYYNSIKQNYSKTQKGSVVVPYFYLGDMLEFFFDTKVLNRQGRTSRTLEDKDSRLVLGTFKFSDYGNPHVSLSEGGPAIESKKIIAGDGKEEKAIEITLKSDTVVANIAHIPISFKSFVAWFNKNIMSTNLKTFSIHKLLTDSTVDLVSRNLSNKILKGSKQINPKFNMYQEIIDERILTNDNKDIPTYLKNLFANKKNYIINYDEKNDNPFKRINSKKAALESSKSEKERLNPENVAYYFITSAREGVDSLNGDYSVDIKKNIYHFFLGDERGLLRDVSFSRNDNPNFTAAQMLDANMGNDNRILRAVYNANIDLYGNNIFVPGMTLYVNPSYPGMRLQDPILLEIGLGGYYRIVEVTNKIQPGLYTTSLKTTWESYGKVPELDLSKKGDISSLRQIIESNKISNIKIE